MNSNVCSLPAASARSARTAMGKSKAWSARSSATFSKQTGASGRRTRARNATGPRADSTATTTGHDDDEFKRLILSFPERPTCAQCQQPYTLPKGLREYHFGHCDPCFEKRKKVLKNWAETEDDFDEI